MNMPIKNVAVVGTGTLGAQIAVQAACRGYSVQAFDLDRAVFERNLDKLLDLAKRAGRSTAVDLAQWPEGAKRIAFQSSLPAALSQAQLVIEAVPENLDLKLKVWAEMDKHAPAGALLATNSSSMPVSKLEGKVADPSRCLNIHFYQMVLGQNMADVMGGSRAKPEHLETARRWVASLGCVPLRVNKELLGFCFNRVWRAVKRETLYMWAGGFVDFRDVDRGWMTFTGVGWGPFGLMDAVGLDVIRDIEMVYYNESKDPKDKPPQALEDKIARGELGVKTGRGFYAYPDPEYARPEFLDPAKLV